MRRIFIFSLFVSFTANAQHTLPVTLLNGTDSTKPVVLYISGDGGWNSFSSSLCKTIQGRGYTVAGLNARSYFWKKRTPEETATEIAAYINDVIRPHASQSIVLVGYSFGADVVPFITGKFPAEIRERIHSVVLLSPSRSTDFEIHISDLLGWGKERSMDVVAAINTMSGVRISAVFGDDETEFPLSSVRNINFKYRHLPGGHHYEGNMNMVAAAVIAGL